MKQRKKKPPEKPAKKRERRGIVSMISIDDLSLDVRDAVLRADGQPIRIVMPKYKHSWDKPARARRII